MTHSRIIALVGGRNFRDLGGYPAIDGRITRWRTLYRSGSLARLTSADVEILTGMGIQAVYDLRNERERATEPHHWPDSTDLLVYQRDYNSSGAELSRLLDMPWVKGSDAHQAMMNNYRELPYEQAEAYKALFEGIATGNLPLLFNCSAGKDRTGIAAALLLDLLGIDRDVILDDYILTERAFNFRMLVDKSSEGRAPSEDVVDALIAAHPDYLNACFEQITNQHGDVASYFDEVLGINLDVQEHIRQKLLVEA
ncbi:tyrosine-protein phosphatase [Haliea sp. E1-2-M8]|uniref:tyrosine-protein phosphatase n=1 Tax=Haliea sp. E1-2-M8 TaxID=3064706 RepID=UPI002727F6B2|nr:tyrosine-protein phosphatase [Haliea sp. E1-2-M8]MDO8863986.1 tyrosine-protein phosphatase [Haliea sp. E1-2-M8]